MKIDGNAIRVGNVLEHKGRLWVATKIQHTQPGKGGAYMQVELKDIRSGTKTNERFRSAETVERVRLDMKDYQYLYMEGDNLQVMDTETYEQHLLPAEMLGDKTAYLQDGMMITVESYNGDPILVRVPAKVTQTVVETEPVIKGQTAASSDKPAKLDNGVRVMVPPFVNTGDRIIVNTEDDSYVERAKD